MIARACSASLRRLAGALAFCGACAVTPSSVVGQTFGQTGEWRSIIARGDTSEVSSKLTQVMNIAKEEADGRIVVQVPGTPDEAFVELITQVFEPSRQLVEVGIPASRIASERCGQISPTYLRNLVAANPGRFVDSKVVAAKPGEPAELILPACLNARTSVLHRVMPGDSVASMAKSVSGQDFGPAYCVELKQLNVTDICAESQAGRLRAGLLIRLPKRQSEMLVTTSSAALTASKDPQAEARLTQELPNAVVAAYNVASVAAPPSVPFVVDPLPTTIVPTGECPSGKPPFDSARLVDTITRVQLDAKSKGMPFEQKVLVGVIDTGLYDLTRNKFFERVPPGLLAGGDKRLLNLISLARAYPGALPNIAPDAGVYADHGTHVAGLVVGGPDFWDYVLKTKFTDQGTPLYIAAYVPGLVPIKVMSSPGGGLPPRTNTGEISSALAFLRKEVHIINLSYTAKYDPGLFDTFSSIKTNNKVLIVSAAGNDFLSSGLSLDQMTMGSRILPAMLSKPDEPLFMTVGALDDSGTGTAADFSQRGLSYVDLFAPGTCIRSFGAGEPFEKDTAYSGTSQAAPLVSFAAALLYRLGVPLERLKERLIDTVDASDALIDISVSGGSLNLPKALDYLDDIVVFKKANPNEPPQPPEPYRKGVLVPLLNGQEAPQYVGSLCQGSIMQLRNVRRIAVRQSNGMMRYAIKDVPIFQYHECKAKDGVLLRLKATDGKPNRDFTLAEVQEIIPRPQHWQR